VFVVHTDNLTRFNRAGFLRPMDDLTSAGGIDANDFDPNVWSAVERDGKHMGIPLDIHTIGMYYNKALFRKAGIVDANGEPKPPTNRAEFVDALRKLTRDENGDGVKESYGLAFTWLRTNSYTLIRQWGGDILSRDGTRVVLDHPEPADAMQFAVDMIDKEKVIMPPENISTFGGAFIGFRQGKLGIVFEGIYMLPELRRQKDLDFGAAPVPQIGPHKAAWASSHVLCLRNDLSARELDASKRFVKFLSDNSLDWAEGGQIPVRKSLRDTDRFRGMTAQNAFAQQIPYAAYYPSSPFINENMAAFDPAVEAILRRSQTPEQAFADAAKKIRAVFERNRVAEMATAGGGDGGGTR
jgi:multiple sugar transport system substrate-binding protein